MTGPALPRPGLPWPGRVRRALDRPPPVRVGALVTLPGAAVRTAPAVALLACAALAGVPGGSLGPPALLAAAALAVARPALPVAPVAAAVLGLGVLAGPDLLGTAEQPGAPWRLAGLVLAVDVLLRTAALAAQTAWRGRVERAVLRGTARAAAGSQALAQVLLVIAVRLRAGGGGDTVTAGSLRVPALAAVTVLLLLAVPAAWRTRHRRPDPPSPHERP